jgi:tetratricopeptide (TPR) repeat protein
LLGLGAASWVEGRPAAALIQLQAAQKANPDEPLTYLYLGLAWQDLDRPEQAAAAYERVLGLSRDPALVDLARARLLAIYTQIIPARAGQEGGASAQTP